MKKLNGIKLKGWNRNYKWNYTGMVNEHNLPHGYGRVIDSNNVYFIDAHFKDGKVHGYSRFIK